MARPSTRSLRSLAQGILPVVARHEPFDSCDRELAQGIRPVSWPAMSPSTRSMRFLAQGILSLSCLAMSESNGGGGSRTVLWEHRQYLGLFSLAQDRQIRSNRHIQVRNRYTEIQRAELPEPTRREVSSPSSFWYPKG